MYTFAKEVMFQAHPLYRADLHENFTTDVSVDKKELIKFWKSLPSGFGSRTF